MRLPASWALWSNRALLDANLWKMEEDDFAPVAWWAKKKFVIVDERLLVMAERFIVFYISACLYYCCPCWRLGVNVEEVRSQDALGGLTFIPNT